MEWFSLEYCSDIASHWNVLNDLIKLEEIIGGGIFAGVDNVNCTYSPISMSRLVGKYFPRQIFGN